MDLNLNGWRTIVTGATSGLGQSIAAGFVGEGAKVLACGRNATQMPEGVEASLCVDLTDPGAAELVVATAAEQLGGIDAVVAAAGAAVSGTVESASEETWEAGLELNLMSIIRLLRSSVPHLREGGGRIVILSALSAREPRGNHVVSNVSKAGVTALSKTLSREVGSDGILVNCVAPGRIRSGQLDRAFPDEEARAAFSREHIPLNRFGSSEEVVPVTLLLASPLNSYITGQTVAVDGGMGWAL